MLPFEENLGKKYCEVYNYCWRIIINENHSYVAYDYDKEIEKARSTTDCNV